MGAWAWRGRNATARMTISPGRGRRTAADYAVLLVRQPEHEAVAVFGLVGRHGPPPGRPARSAANSPSLAGRAPQSENV
jgi:hypothetical protein